MRLQSTLPFVSAIVRLATTAAFAFLATSADAENSPLRLIEKDGKPIAIEASGLAKEAVARLTKLTADDPAWPRVLGVWVGAREGGDKIPAMAGNYALRGDTIVFTPSFPFKAGLSYLAVYYPPPAGPLVSPARYERVFAVPAPPRGEPTKIVAFYPSADSLPENQLRFYVHFSAPMSRGEIYDHLQLLKADGTPVELPFLEIGEELWDHSGTRLTLLIDPGRIKRGLKPREENGPVLENGHKYTLAIDRALLDASGRPLAEGFTKKFSAGPPIELAIDPQAWRIELPPAGTKAPLTVTFPRPLDRALLERTISVARAGEESISGNVTVTDSERRWSFVPDAPWTAGKHELVIDTVLEDLAGNRIGRPFEVDEFSEVSKAVVPEYYRLPLAIE